MDFPPQNFAPVQPHFCSLRSKELLHPLLTTFVTLPFSGSPRTYSRIATLEKSQSLRNRVTERPPGLLQHVLIVLVFWSWVLPLTRLPPSSRSLRLCLWASILLYGRVDIAWICCSQLPHHPCKNGTHSTCFYSTGGHTPTLGALRL